MLRPLDNMCFGLFFASYQSLNQQANGPNECMDSLMVGNISTATMAVLSTLQCGDRMWVYQLGA